MYNALINTPLQRAMVLIWGVGLVHMTFALSNTLPGLGWALTALLAGAALILFAGRFREPALLPLAITAGLGAVLTFVYQMGVNSLATFAAVTALYALLVWRTVALVLTLPATERMTALLDFRGGYRSAGGRQMVERYTHGSSLTLVSLSLLAGMQLGAFVALPVLPWPVVSVSLVFFWLAGNRYRCPFYSYLLIGVSAWGLLSLYSERSLNLEGIPLDHAAVAVLVALLSVTSMVAARWLCCRSLSRIDDSGALERLLVRPLERSSLLMAALAVVHVGAMVLAGVITNPGWTGAVAFGLAASTLIATDRRLVQPLLILIGTLLATLSLSWIYSARVHGALPFGLWPGGGAADGQWLLLGVIALILASLAQYLASRRDLAVIYVQPLSGSAFLVWGWTLLGAVAMFLRGQSTAAWVIAVLCGCLFPMLRALNCGTALRGFSLALLSSLWLAAVVGIDHLSGMGWLTATLWGYALWGMSNFALPRFNERFPQWAVAPDTWPWMGLLLLGAGLTLALIAGPPPWAAPWLLSLCASGYLFLMLRNSAWTGFAWLAALALLLGGLLFSASRYLNGLIAFDVGAIGSLAIETLVIANLFLLALPLWRRYGDMISSRLGLQSAALHTPLLGLSFAVCALWFTALVGWDTALIVMPAAFPTGRGLAVGLGALLTGSLLHGLVRWRSAISAHLLVVAVFLTLVAAWGAVRPFEVPLLLALWSIVATVASLEAPKRRKLIDLVSVALSPWVYIAPAASLISLALLGWISTSERLLTLCVLAGVATVLGLGRSSRTWLCGAVALMVSLLHGLWLMWVPRVDVLGLLPWYALQSALMAWGLGWLAKELAHRTYRNGDRTMIIGDVALKVAPWLAGAALLEWSMHIIALTLNLIVGHAPQIVGGGFGVGAAITTAVMLIGWCIGRARVHRDDDRWVYGVALLLATTGVYCRLLWQGLAPLGVWDTAAIMAAAYGLLLVQRMTGSGAVVKLMMVLPLLAVATVPFQLASTHASLALLAIGTLYLLTRHATRLGAPLYLSLLALNAAVYLWVPSWAERYGLLQVYLIPAALSVLFLLHLHRREIRGNVANGVRLAALSMLYATATVDVFIQEQLSVFVLALALSLSGIIVGIMLRTRGFLYAGATFLLLNVLGQLLQLYPDQRLGRALVLMTLGASITGVMLWFNLKRETIMARIRVFRADIATWD